MPELPDVATYGRYLDSTALHRKIERVEIRSADVLDGISAATLRRRLQGRTFDSTRRHGKHLFVATDHPETWLILHFGMTGRLDYARNDDTPKHARVIFHFADGGRLAYVCQRKLGRVRIADDPSRFVEEKDLGPDALADVDLSRFRDSLSGRRGSIKAALMNQKLMAGVGNVYADEALFRARIHPETPCTELDDDAAKSLHRALHAVLETAIERGADVDNLPDSWLLPHRDEDARCPRCGGRIQTTKVGGRTTYFCAKCQR